MAKKYRVELTDGRKFLVEVDGDQPPTEQEILAQLGETTPQHGPPNQVTAKAEDFTPKPEGSAFSRMVSGFAQRVLPSTTLSDYWQGPAYAVQHPLDAASLLFGAAKDAAFDQGGKAKDAAGRAMSAPTLGGKVAGAAQALGHGAAAAIPFVGPAAASVGEQAASGDIAGAFGGAAGLLAPAGVAAARGRLPQRVPPVASNRNPVQANAVAFGQQRGIPVDAATATGRPLVATIQKRASDSMGGATVAEKFKDGQGSALTRVGNEIADQVHPQPVMPEQAGRGVTAAIGKRAEDASRKADTAYDTLRQFEQQSAQAIGRAGGVQGPATAARPFTDVPLAVDVAPTKAAMRPIFDALKREADLVPLQGDKARALTALDRLMQAPDQVPLSVADGALSDLKDMARVDQAFRRTAGQGVAAEAVKNLDAAVVASARQFDRQHQTATGGAFDALMDGRRATIAKYDAIGVLDQLRDEPVQVFRQATWQKDAGIDRLREMARLAPGEMPKIGRAWIDDALSTATAEGDFRHAAKLYADWEKLGPETKKLLYADPQHVRDLDNFFLLAKKAAENPNPSGTARVMTAFNVVSSVPSYALAKLLYSPAGVRVLTQGFRIPAGNRLALGAWQRSVRQAVQGTKDSASTGFPASAQRQTDDDQRASR